MIFITGDTHSEFERFGAKIFTAPQGSYIIICGDFGGVWDGSKTEKYWLDWLAKKPFTFLFIDGNHENFDMLYSLPVTDWHGGKVHKVRDNVIHLMRGQVFEIEGFSFFAFGGASSHDVDEKSILEADDPEFSKKKKRLDRRRIFYRVNHESWWKEELPSDEEMSEGLKNLARAGNKVDFVLTHCAPTSVQNIFGKRYLESDILTDYLDEIKAACDFKAWFFGHYHDNKTLGDNFFMLYENIVEIGDFLN